MYMNMFVSMNVYGTFFAFIKKQMVLYDMAWAMGWG